MMVLQATVSPGEACTCAASRSSSWCRSPAAKLRACLRLLISTAALPPPVQRTCLCGAGGKQGGSSLVCRHCQAPSARQVCTSGQRGGVCDAAGADGLILPRPCPAASPSCLPSPPHSWVSSCCFQCGCRHQQTDCSACCCRSAKCGSRRELLPGAFRAAVSTQL